MTAAACTTAAWLCDAAGEEHGGRCDERGGVRAVGAVVVGCSPARPHTPPAPRAHGGCGGSGSARRQHCRGRGSTHPTSRRVASVCVCVSVCAASPAPRPPQRTEAPELPPAAYAVAGLPAGKSGLAFRVTPALHDRVFPHLALELNLRRANRTAPAPRKIKIGKAETKAGTNREQTRCWHLIRTTRRFQAPRWHGGGSKVRRHPFCPGGPHRARCAATETRNGPTLKLLEITIGKTRVQQMMAVRIPNATKRVSGKV